MLARRRFLQLLALRLALDGQASAAEFSRELRIDVLKGDWRSNALSDVRAVVRSAAEEIWRHCPGQRLLPLLVYHRADFPQTDFVHDLRGRIRIGLATADRRWAQMVFQLGHEFIHALAQHSEAARRAWRTPRHANLWFEECLCETAALFVLRRLSERWRTDPPFPNGQPHANELADYATERLARADHQLPAGVEFTVWFAENEPRLRAHAGLRASNVIVARQLLPFFEADPAGWEAACFLNLGKRDREKSRAQYFTEWQTASPAALRPLVARVAGVFDA